MSRKHDPFLMQVNHLSHNTSMSYHRRSSTRHHAVRIIDESTMQVDGMPVHVTRKTTHNMYLRIKPPLGTVEISAPVQMKDEDITRLVRARMPWITKQQARLWHSMQEMQAGFTAANGAGAAATYAPRANTPETIRNTPAEAGRDDSLVAPTDSNTATTMDLAAGQSAWNDDMKSEAERRIRARLPELLRHWTTIIGRGPTHVTLRLMTSRWGSCTPATGRIRLNLQLGLMKPELLEYVLVHEMTHLWENGHGARFQRRMDAFLPNWRTLRHTLNQQVAWK